MNARVGRSLNRPALDAVDSDRQRFDSLAVCLVTLGMNKLGLLTESETITALEEPVSRFLNSNLELMQA